MAVENRDDAARYEHESYGMVRFTRSSGCRRIFGSSLPEHHEFVTLTVANGSREHHLGRDWYSAGKQLIEVTLSPHQFADLLTTMNAGSGVPCSVDYIGGKRIPEAPATPLEAEKIRADFAGNVEKVAKRAEARQKKADEILAKTSISKKDREELAMMFRMNLQDVRADIPFWQESFEEAAAKTVAHVKAEIDAFVTHSVMVAGYEAITNGTAAPLALPAKDDDQ